MTSHPPSSAPAPAPPASFPRPQARRYTIEQFFATRLVGGASWAPDGERIVVVTNISGRENLWLLPATGGWPVQLTVSEQRQASPAWSPDGRWIAFQSDQDADEQWDLFLVDPRDGAVENLTRTPKISEEEPVWSPDGRLLAFALKPAEAPNYELALVDLATREVQPLTRGTPADWSLSPVAFVPGGHWLLANRIHASAKDGHIVLVDLDSGAARTLTPHVGEQRWRATDVSPDGTQVLLTSDAHGFDRVALLDLAHALAHPAGTAPRLAWLTGPDAERSACRFSPDGGQLAWEANVDGNGEIWVGRPDGAARRLPGGEGFASYAGRPTPWSPDGGRLLVRRSAADSPGDLSVLALEGGARTPLTHAFVGGVDPADMVAPALVRYPSRDGLEIAAFLYLPWKVPQDGSHPAIVWVHGGPRSQTLNGFNRQVQFLVNQGYVVLAPNYRGSTGYGKTFMDANRFDMGGGDLADVVAGAGFLAETGYVDRRRIAVGGGSYGGYLTMCAVTKTPEVWAAGVALFPFVNWFTEVEHEDPLLRQYDLATMGDPEAQAALYRDRSPVFFLDQVRAPLFLVAGRNDPRCPPGEAEQVLEELRRQGRTCELLLYEDEGHGFARRENLFDAHRRLVAFLDRELRGATARPSAGS